MSNKKDFNEKYEKMLSKLQIELVQMQEWVIDSGKKIAIIFREVGIIRRLGYAINFL